MRLWRALRGLSGRLGRSSDHLQPVLRGAFGDRDRSGGRNLEHGSAMPCDPARRPRGARTARGACARSTSSLYAPAMDHLDTRVVWAGESESLAHGGTQVPVQHSIAFGYDDVDSWLDVALGNAPGHIYTRNTNPTVRAFERKVADLEGAEHAIGFATGMAAVSATRCSRC